MSKLQCFYGHDDRVINNIYLLVDTHNAKVYPSFTGWNESMIKCYANSHGNEMLPIGGVDTDRYIDFLATNPEKVWEIEIKD